MNFQSIDLRRAPPQVKNGLMLPNRGSDIIMNK